MEAFIPWTLVKRGVKQEVITPIESPEAFRMEVVAARRAEEDAQDTASVRALGLAHYWQHLLDTGKVRSLREIAAAEGMDFGHVDRIGRLSQLAPCIVEACVAGNASELALESLNRRAMRADWAEQRLAFFAYRG
ncbi:hypothetical protein ACW73L_18405 [Methylolobus aquaticus]